MYIQSPMENFNRNNPFIIIAKKLYDNIIDLVQEFSKDIIQFYIMNGIVWILSAILGVTSLVLKTYIPYLIFVIGMLVIFIIVANRWTNAIHYFMTDHFAMKEFDRISAMQVNDILTLNNEDILNCVQHMHELRGELVATKKYYIIFMTICLVVQVLAILLTVAILFI